MLDGIGPSSRDKLYGVGTKCVNVRKPPLTYRNGTEAADVSDLPRGGRDLISGPPLRGPRPPLHVCEATLVSKQMISRNVSPKHFVTFWSSLLAFFAQREDVIHGRCSCHLVSYTSYLVL